MNVYITVIHSLWFFLWLKVKWFCQLFFSIFKNVPHLKSRPLYIQGRRLGIRYSRWCRCSLWGRDRKRTRRWWMRSTGSSKHQWRFRLFLNYFTFSVKVLWSSGHTELVLLEQQNRTKKKWRQCKKNWHCRNGNMDYLGLDASTN